MIIDEDEPLVIFEGSGDTTTKHNNYGRLERERDI